MYYYVILTNGCNKFSYRLTHKMRKLMAACTEYECPTTPQNDPSIQSNSLIHRLWFNVIRAECVGIGRVGSPHCSGLVTTRSVFSFLLFTFPPFSFYFYWLKIYQNFAFHREIRHIQTYNESFHFLMCSQANNQQ